ncbi:MAG: FAD-dependent oxidoreductase [Planctomycetota bacterium]
MHMHRMPIIATVDLLIQGGSSAAVGLAETAAARGRSVLLLENGCLLGEECCATLEIGDRRPLAITTELEDRCLRAGVAFRYDSRIIAVLQDADGHVGGVLIGDRSGWQVVHCRQVVDATPERVVCGLADPALRRRGRQRASLVCMAPEPVPGMDATPAGQVRFAERDWPLWRHLLDLDCGDGSVAARAAAEQEARLRCFHPHQQRMADRCRFAEDLPESAPAPGLCSLGLADAEALPPMLPVEQLGFPAQAPGEPALRPPPLHPRLTDLPSLLRPAPALPMLAGVDVLVVGGGTAGAPAGIAAARAGADTLVCEGLANLGGVGTEGLIAKYWHGNRCGFTSEIDTGVARLDPTGASDAARPIWNVERKMHWLLQALTTAGGRAWFGSSCQGALVQDGRVAGALIATPWGTGLVQAGCSVDASGNADLAAAAGADCRCIAGDHVAVQGTGLPPRDPDRHYRNSDHTFTDDTDSEDRSQTFVVARRRFITAFDSGRLVDSRERRQIRGRVTLSPLDICIGRRWPDAVVEACSNFDSHGYYIHPVFLLVPPDKEPMPAQVPLRALQPQALDGILVTGLGISAHRDVLPVVRMQADVQNQGYAAGRAAAGQAQTGRIDVDALQEHLRAIGNLGASAAVDTPALDDGALAHAARGGLDTTHAVALLLSDPQRSAPLLRQELPTAQGTRRLQLIRCLLACADTSGADELIAAWRAAGWDQGWRFRGMGQFGASLSPRDVDLILLARARAPDSAALMREALAALPADPDLSHCRALAIALQAQADPSAAPLLETLLQTPGIRGHHQHRIDQVAGTVSSDLCDNTSRDASLRELHLARALCACGDPQHHGRSILQHYAEDLRGHYARHARALLAEGCLRDDAA